METVIVLMAFAGVLLVSGAACTLIGLRRQRRRAQFAAAVERACAQ